MVELRSIDVLGGGPAGLYIAQLLKRERPHATVRVYEQNPRGATFGFGVVFSSQALDFLQADDPDTHALITPHMEQWQNMTLVHSGERIVLDGIGFAAIGRLQLIDLLTKQAESAGVEVCFNTPVEDVDALQADLIVGADGLNSRLRHASAASFSPQLSHFKNSFAWFGTNKPFDTLTQTFVSTDLGALNAHHYRYQSSMSTFIVECDQDSFKNHGFATMDEAQTAQACEQLFSDTLQGASLIANKSQWRQFPRLWCNNWTHGNRVLIGDSAHTAHFSVGSGTRLALEDAIALSKSLREDTDLTAALSNYQSLRQPIAQKIVNAANTSAEWYDTFATKLHLSPLDFGFDYITRSGRIDMDRLRKLSPGFMQAYETRLSKQ